MTNPPSWIKNQAVSADLVADRNGPTKQEPSCAVVPGVNGRDLSGDIRTPQVGCAQLNDDSRTMYIEPGNSSPLSGRDLPGRPARLHYRAPRGIEAPTDGAGMRTPRHGRASLPAEQVVRHGHGRGLIAIAAGVALVPVVLAAVIWSRDARTNAAPEPTAGIIPSRPPPKAGYFTMQRAGEWSGLPGDTVCAGRVHRSTWEPRSDNTGPNHAMPDAEAVHRAFAERPVAVAGAVDRRWDTWLLQRVDGQFTGTTDEIFQWAACKWGLADNVLRAIAVRESTWYQFDTYESGRPAYGWGMGDPMPAGTAGASVYCDSIAAFGHDYQKDFGRGVCPETFSIVGVKAWHAPSWGEMPGNQNGTFPFARDSTAFALDYIAAQLRGCVNGWEFWLKHSGHYAAGDIWGCVGAWYSGDWHSSAADAYISRVRQELADVTWLGKDWPRIRPQCLADFGCPGPGQL